MSHQWGRPADAGSWPRPKYVWTISVLILAMMSGLAVTAYRYRTAWMPLQRIYLSAYLRSHLAMGVGIGSGRYRLLYVTDRKGDRLAFNEDVQPATTRADDEDVALNDLAIAAGVRRPRWVLRQLQHAYVSTYLRLIIYDGQRLVDLAKPALWSMLAVLVVGLIAAIPKDFARARARRHGERLKGPELVSIARFNRRLRSGGGIAVGMAQEPSTLAGLVGRPASVRIPRRLEASHILIMGDSGTGKSSLIRQILQQLDARGDTAIIYDPAREYTPQFYRPVNFRA